MVLASNSLGIFDSGIGGLAVVKAIKKLLPLESVVYLADKANFPYGQKTTAEIKKISFKNVNWLLKQKAKIIIIACNTATVKSISFLRKKFPQIFFIGIEPAIKPAAKLSQKGVIILSSPRAAKSNKLKKLMKKYSRGTKVFNLSSLDLVKAVEKQKSFRKIKAILVKTIPSEVFNQADVLVLGCTHFLLIKKQIKKFIGPKIKIIDPALAVAKRTAAVLREKNLLNKKKNIKDQFFTTGKKEKIYGISFKVAA